jgi:hypothetical protein
VRCPCDGKNSKKEMFRKHNMFEKCVGKQKGKQLSLARGPLRHFLTRGRRLLSNQTENGTIKKYYSNEIIVREDHL